MFCIISYFIFRDPNLPEPLPSSTTLPRYNPETKPYMQISLSGDYSLDRFGEPGTSFWTKLLPSIIEVTERAPDDQCTSSPPQKRSLLFNINFVTEDNILLTFIIMTACLFIAYILLCLFNVGRNYAEKRNFKTLL